MWFGVWWKVERPLLAPAAVLAGLIVSLRRHRLVICFEMPFYLLTVVLGHIMVWRGSWASSACGQGTPPQAVARAPDSLVSYCIGSSAPGIAQHSLFKYDLILRRIM